MSVVLVVMTDGRRECIRRTIPSALVNLQGSIIGHLIYDDSGDPEYRDWLIEEFAPLGFGIAWSHAGRQGFSGAIRGAWAVLSQSPARFIFHLEDDFVFHRLIDLDAIADVLDRRPHLVQMALRRQPSNPLEREAGGVVEQYPADYVECTDGHHWWLEHRRFFTTNPSLYRTSLTERTWPDGAYSEGRFSAELFTDPNVHCGYWGARHTGEWVEHIGQRIGTGY
jgi:hypothetical protein